MGESHSPMLYSSSPIFIYCKQKIIRYLIRIGMKKCSQTTEHSVHFIHSPVRTYQRKRQSSNPYYLLYSIHMWLFKIILSKTICVHVHMHGIRFPFWDEIAYTPFYPSSISATGYKYEKQMQPKKVFF